MPDSNPETVYAGTRRGGLYRSADSGQRWEHVLFPARGEISAITSCDESGLVLVGTRAGVYRTWDGLSWQVFSLADGDRIYSVML